MDVASRAVGLPRCLLGTVSALLGGLDRVIYFGAFGKSWLELKLYNSWLGSDPDQKFNQDDLHRLLMCNEVAAAVCGGHAVASDPFCAPFDLSPAIWASGSRRCHLRQDGCTATTIVAIQRIRNDYGLIESESRYRTTLILIKNLGICADPDTRQTRRTPLDRHPGAS